MSLGTLYEAQDPTEDHTGPPTRSEWRWGKMMDSYTIALDETCVRNGTRKILESASTASTARDMKAIVDSLGEEQGLQYWGFR